MLMSVMEIAKQTKKDREYGLRDDFTCAPVQFCKGVFQGILYPKQLQRFGSSTTHRRALLSIR